MLASGTQPTQPSDSWPAIERFLSTREFGAVYHLGAPAVRKMLRNGQLVGIQTPGGWRVCDPGPRLFQMLRDQAVALESVPFIRGTEAALILGLYPPAGYANLPTRGTCAIAGRGAGATTP
jgi:hypothetical protein